MAETITLTIDGKQVVANKGATLLEAARAADIRIPTLCEYKQLVPHGSCRICSVEVEGSRRLSIACATPALEGMVIRTESDNLAEVRRKILQLIFSERNHYCMFCETSGDCELQALAYRYGVDHFRYRFQFPSLAVDGSHKYYVHDPNRCILCTRCVRACSELAANGTLGLMRRGAATVISADVNQPLGQSSCVSCGTCVQICPTGALYDKASAYAGRNGDTSIQSTICSGCSLGCPVKVVSRAERILRIEGDFDSKVNRGVLCEQGRYAPLRAKLDRNLYARIRRGGRLERVSMPETLDLVAKELQEYSQGGDASSIAGIVSPRTANEAIYLFQKMFRAALGSNDLTTLGDGSASDRSFTASYAGAALADVERADHVLVIDADLAQSYQVLGFTVKRALKAGATLTLIGPGDNHFADLANMHLVPSQPDYGSLVNGIMHAIVVAGMAKRVVDPRSHFANNIERYAPAAVAMRTGVSEALIKAAAIEYARAKSPILIWAGGDDGLELAVLSLATVTGNYDGLKARILRLGEEVNSRGAREMGGTAAYLPGRITWSSPLVQRFADIWDSPLPTKLEGGAAHAVYFLLSDDTTPPTEAMWRLARRARFVVVHSAYRSPLEEVADVVLPAPIWAEKEGSVTGADGSIRRLLPASRLPGDVRQEWALLSELLTKLGRLRSYRSVDEVFAEIARVVPSYGGQYDLPSSTFTPYCVEF